jgi:hypothetical protein
LLFDQNIFSGLLDPRVRNKLLTLRFPITRLKNLSRLDSRVNLEKEPLLTFSFVNQSNLMMLKLIKSTPLQGHPVLTFNMNQWRKLLFISQRIRHTHHCKDLSFHQVVDDPRDKSKKLSPNLIPRFNNNKLSHNSLNNNNNKDNEGEGRILISKKIKSRRIHIPKIPTTFSLFSYSTLIISQMMVIELQKIVLFRLNNFCTFLETPCNIITSSSSTDYNENINMHQIKKDGHDDEHEHNKNTVLSIKLIHKCTGLFFEYILLHVIFTYPY